MKKVRISLRMDQPGMKDLIDRLEAPRRAREAANPKPEPRKKAKRVKEAAAPEPDQVSPGLTRQRARELLNELSIVNLTDLLMAKAGMEGQNCRVRFTWPRLKKSLGKEVEA